MTIKELIASKLRPIGDAIREKDGSNELIPIDDMPQAIRNIQGGSVNVVKSGGTVVPNSGTISEVYFNTNLSIEEVVSLINSVSQDAIYVLFGIIQHDLATEFYHLISISKMDGITVIEDIDAREYLFASDSDPLEEYGIARWDFVGWNTNIVVNGKYTLTSGITLQSENLDLGVSVGNLNDKLTDLISATPFENKVIKTLEGNYKAVDIVVTENKTVDIETYLDNKQMPMSVTVNVGGEDVYAKIIELCKNSNNPYNAYEIKYLFGYIPKGVGLNYSKYMPLIMDCLETKQDSSNARELYRTFDNNQDINGEFIFKNTACRTFNNTFYTCNNLKKVIIDLSEWDTEKDGINVESTFCNCSNLEEVEFSKTFKAASVYNTFNGCNKLKKVSPIDFILMASSQYNPFSYCSALETITLLNINSNLKIGSGTSWGHLLTLDSLINTVKECINVGSAKTLTMGTANLNKIASTYVKFTDSSVTTIPTNEKGDVVVCESTDTGAMLLSDYALLKNWTLA